MHYISSSQAVANNSLFRIEEATIGSIHSAMREGRITSRRLVETYLARIEAYDKKGPAINSIITTNPNALEEASMLDWKFRESGLIGPMHGIPVLLKDNIETRDMPTTGGSLSLDGYQPDHDAPMVKRFREAGAIILAKVNLHEFALCGETFSSRLGQTLNPYDLSRTPGGSSGGTGAAVAANFGTVGVGTDTVNSVRSPASACSLVGIRPTVGLVTRNGIIPYSLTQDTAGPITRTVSDAALMLDVMVGYDPDDPITVWSVGNIPGTYTSFLSKDGLKGARVGVLRSFFGAERKHDEVNEVSLKSIDIVRQEGAEIKFIDVPLNAEKLLNEVSLNLYELKEQLNRYLEHLSPLVAKVKSLDDIIASGKYHPGIEANIRKAMGLSTSDNDYCVRMTQRIRLQETYLKIMADEGLDAMVFPHQKQLVALVGQPQAERNGVLAAVTGFPSIVVPAGFSRPSESAPIGIPIGIEFIGRPWSEPLLIRLAHAFENATHYRLSPASTPAL
ncbi:MAG: amidase family protein [Dissulfurispiraceae bacterium]|jgi:amidase